MKGLVYCQDRSATNNPLAHDFERSEKEWARFARQVTEQKSISNTKKRKRETAVSQGLNTFVLLMYSHLTREQRYVIYLELQRGTSLEVIAQLIDVSKSTVSREIKRNSTKNGKYVWFKAHDKAEERKKRTPGNRGLSPLLRWRIEQLIKDEQWSPR